QHKTENTDCDDDNTAVYTGAVEYCNGEDDVCDGNTDEDDAADAITYYADIDNDGYGDTDSSVNACTQPAQHTIDSADCDDGNNAVYPGADEYCNGEDDDCDGNTDEDDAVDATLWYYDGDVDGYGIESNSVRACTTPTDYVDNAQDCNDTNGYGPNCTSCKEIYDQGLGSTDDYYLIQPSAQLPDQEVWCDMSSGGWTLVYLATNSGGLTENGSVTSGSAIGSTPFAPGDTGHYKLSDDVINSLRSGAVNNDLKVVIEYNGSILGTTWHPSSCTLASGTFHAASHVCNKSVNDGMDSTNYTQSGHPGSLSRWYVDSGFGYIWPNTHIGPVPGGMSHGSSLPATYCTWYDSRHCPTSGVFQIWAY
ncbi:MAG: MopE-related protein, partial [Myxococcota bacterium]|nr:MopE-related protein [Myxococcota bacterium]